MDYYDRDGNVIDMDTWGRLHADRSYQRIALTAVTGDSPPRTLDVSTVWLGIDHGWGSGPPVIFETMVFGDGEDEDGRQRRYTTLAEARDGHAEIVAELRAELSRAVVLDKALDR